MEGTGSVGRHRDAGGIGEHQKEMGAGWRRVGRRHLLRGFGGPGYGPLEEWPEFCRSEAEPVG